MNAEYLAFLVGKLSATVIDKEIRFVVLRDKKNENGRFYIQCQYDAPCTVTGENKTWNGRKWYLSDHMTEDEVVKTAYGAFKACVEHEIMEGFKFEGQRVFNPHTPFRVLMESAKVQVFREPQT